MSQPTTKSTKPTESDVYDRQIRLWGAESQQKMMNSRVLYIHVTGVSAEILKNLALAGIKATLCDVRPASDMAPHVFTPTSTSKQPEAKRLQYASVAHAVQPLVEEMNPLLGGCPILEKAPSQLTSEDLEPFTVVIASQVSLQEAVRLAQLTTTSESRAFYLVDCFGWNGAALMDLGKNVSYRPEQGKQLLDPKVLAPYVPLEHLIQVPLSKCVNRFHKTPPPVYLQYRCLLEYHQQKGMFPLPQEADTQSALELWTTFLKEQGCVADVLSKDTLEALAKASMSQVSPVCAVLGGMLGNEVIKVISGKGEPANNTILFDGRTCKAWTFLVQSI
eukprot:Nitzschia sp. Nitz4//scaffold21_size171442//72825//73823//NITZ4_002162-RA/size171442-processed-gene-0.119-mRNA-1//1//CDS//3329542414//4540//frame0